LSRGRSAPPLQAAHELGPAHRRFVVRAPAGPGWDPDRRHDLPTSGQRELARVEVAKRHLVQLKPSRLRRRNLGHLDTRRERATSHRAGRARGIAARQRQLLPPPMRQVSAVLRRRSKWTALAGSALGARRSAAEARHPTPGHRCSVAGVRHETWSRARGSHPHRMPASGGSDGWRRLRRHPCRGQPRDENPETGPVHQHGTKVAFVNAEASR